MKKTLDIREAVSIDRQAEFFSESELTKQMGHTKEYWPIVIVAELIDNALDHCEECKRAPEIAVVLGPDFIEVIDNGEGMADDLVTKMLDYQNRTSSRLGHVSPTRGTQGNAAKCLFAVPCVLSDNKGIVEIESSAVHHIITVHIDPIEQKPKTDHLKEVSERQSGTSIKVHLPCLLDNLKTQIVQLVNSYVCINPHASFTCRIGNEVQIESKASQPISKWNASKGDPPAWHDSQSFQNLIHSQISADRKNGKNTSLVAFVQRFHGLKRHQKAQLALESVGMETCSLESLVTENGLDVPLVDKILGSMKQFAVSPKPFALGRIGKPHLQQHFANQFNYQQRHSVTSSGLPYQFEVAFHDRDDDFGRRLITGVNYSSEIRTERINEIDSCLEHQMVDEDAPVDVFVHVTIPRVEYTNRGKTEVALNPDIHKALFGAIKKVTANFTAKIKARERDAARQSENRVKRGDSTMKEAIFAVLEEAICSVSDGGKCQFSARTLYYAVRPLVQQYHDQPIQQSYLDKVIDEYEERNGIIELRTRDPRGILIEPHTGKQLNLGTREVNEYRMPDNLYQSILYVEKKGLWPLFQLGQIAEKYDAALIFSEGYSVRAAQYIMQMAAKVHNMKVLVFHDADPSGYGIAESIGKNSGAHQFDFEVIDAGLKITEAVAMGLPTEKFTRQKALQQGICFTPEELEYFQGEPQSIRGKSGRPTTQWINCQRVELNALAATPDRFIRWIEEKLKKHGVMKKLIPTVEVVEEQVKASYDESLHDLIEKLITEEFAIAEKVEQVSSRMAKPGPLTYQNAYKSLENWSRNLEPKSWITIADGIGTDLAMKQRERILPLIREMVARKS